MRILILAAAMAGAVACSARGPAIGQSSAAASGTLQLGDPCAAGSDCASGFCVDAVCCNGACGGGTRDNLSCSHIYGPTPGTVYTDGTCATLTVGDSCGTITSTYPCTWRGSQINGGGNCPNPTNSGNCFSCSDNSQCGGAFPICDTSTGTCVQCLVDTDCTAGEKCNKSTDTCGAQCTSDADCTSTETCQSGVCTPVAQTFCASDSDCGDPSSGMVCDDVTRQCVPGCRATGGNECAPGASCTSHDATVGACLTVEGGGAGCSAAPAGAAGAARFPWIALALLPLVLALRRRSRP